jgi:hypothetical protein
MPAYPSGVSGGSAVELNAPMIAFLTALRAKVPSSIAIYVTSGVRGATEQARALITKRKEAGDAGVYKLYGQKDLVQEILSVPNDQASMEAVLIAQMARGRFLSRHMRKDALDLQRKYWSADQLNAVVAACQELGAKTLVESNPPHLHLERIGGGSLTDAAAAAARGVLQLATTGTSRSGAIGALRVSSWALARRYLVFAGAGIAFFFALWLWQRRGRRRGGGGGGASRGPIAAPSASPAAPS